MEILLYLALILLTVLAAVAPAVLYCLIVWWLDRYEKEPWGLLAATFIWGAIPAILLSLIAEFVIGAPFAAFLGQSGADVAAGSVVAPVVEESVKALAILAVFLIFRREFDGVMDGIVYGALVGFGFAMTENGLFFLAALVEGDAAMWLALVFVRTLVFGLNHGLFSGIVGMGFGYASMADSAWKRWLAPVVALGAAIFVHAVHNLSTTLASELCWPVVISLLNDWGGVAILVIIVFLSWDREKRCITEELDGEVTAGTLSQDVYDTATSYGARVSAQWKALASNGPSDAWRVRRLHQRATELAFAKRRLQRAPGDKVGERVVSRLREQIRALQEEMA
ncbi:MAG TPA: PrsW family glutamic-type intramembrane protease [Anaerolineae bacterium]|nr:PrsW family glutamic-type intramembrane protease [Anaerolineae bacterium]